MTDHPDEAAPAAGDNQELALVTMLRSDDEAVVFGSPTLIDSLARSSRPLPENLSAGFRRLAAVAPELAGSAQAMSGRWVKLTKESAEALAKYGPTPAGGGAISGVVRFGDGSIAQHLSFVDPGTLSRLAATLPALGAAAAMQVQLAHIEKSLGEIKERLDYVIGHLHDEDLADLSANLSVLEDVYRAVERNGELDDDHWQLVANLAQPVRRLHELTSRKLASLESALDADVSIGRRVAVLNRALHRDHALLWLEAHVHAELALVRWQALYLLRQAGQHPSTVAGLLDELEADRKARHALLLGLAGKIARYLRSGSTLQEVLDKIRIISRMRLGRLLSELESVLAVYRRELAVVGAEQEALAPVKSPAALAPGVADEDERLWQDLLQHLGGVSRWAGDARERAVALARQAKDRIVRQAPAEAD